MTSIETYSDLSSLSKSIQTTLKQTKRHIEDLQEKGPLKTFNEIQDFIFPMNRIAKDLMGYHVNKVSTKKLLNDLCAYNEKIYDSLPLDIPINSDLAKDIIK